jgi:hypothetical protein
MRLRMLSAIMLASLVLIASAALGEGTRTWEQSKFDELVKGTAHGVAIRSSGGLELAPAFKALYTSPSTYIWAIAADGSGDVFAAAGAPARVYEVTPEGQSSVIFEPQELQVQALLVDKTGALFAATAPDGKVYKIERHTPVSKKEAPPKKGTAPEAKPAESAWSSHVYFDPGTKYIWDLAQDSSGNLYVATGDHGEVYRVTPKGEHSLFFKSDEVHIRVLDIDPKGNVIAGSDGSGLVYRISPSGQAFVLYSAPKKEITALAIDSAGNIYAGGAGEKRPGLGPGSGSFSAAAITPTMGNPGPGPTGMGMGMGNAPGGGSAVMGSFPAPGAGATGGSEIYRIAPDGSPTKVWSSREDLVYALGFDQRGRLLAGTGNRGHIFAIVGDDYFIDLLRAGASQITSFAKAPGGGLYVSTSNLGKLFLLGPAPETEGSYESDVFDAHIFSRWGRAEFRAVGNVELLTRSGNVDNPDRNWSPWTKVDLRKDGEAGVPAARFIQWKAVLRAGTPAPRLDSVLLNYLPKNVAPTIDDVSVQVGTRYQSLPKPMGGADQGSSGSNPSQGRFEPPVPSVHDRDSIGVKWTVHDDNEDQMVYSVYYRGDGESRWLLLKDNLTDKFYSFDASLLPDGGYTIKVVASDAPSHSPSEALSSEKESSRFEVDTTPPHIENLNAAVDGSQIRVSFGAVDSYSPIKRAEYSVDAGDWQFVEPLGQLSDSRSETYDFRVNVPSGEGKTKARVGAAAGNGADGDPVTPPGSREHVVVIRVYDRFENMSSAKAITRAK